VKGDEAFSTTHRLPDTSRRRSISLDHWGKSKIKLIEKIRHKKNMKETIGIGDRGPYKKKALVRKKISFCKVIE